MMRLEVQVLVVSMDGWIGVDGGRGGRVNGGKRKKGGKKEKEGVRENGGRERKRSRGIGIRWEESGDVKEEEGGSKRRG